MCELASWEHSTSEVVRQNVSQHPNLVVCVDRNDPGSLWDCQLEGGEGERRGGREREMEERGGRESQGEVERGEGEGRERERGGRGGRERERGRKGEVGVVYMNKRWKYIRG